MVGFCFGYSLHPDRQNRAGSGRCEWMADAIDVDDATEIGVGIDGGGPLTGSEGTNGKLSDGRL